MSLSIRRIVAAVLLVSTASMAERTRLVIVPLGSGEGVKDGAATKFSTLVSDQLKSRSDTVDVVAPPLTKTTSDKPVLVKRGASSEALGAIESGKKAFDELRLEDAAKDLRRGIDGLLSDPATADFEMVTEAYVKLAASYFRLGEEKDAKQALTNLARIAPEMSLPSGYPPVFQREFDKAKKRLEKQSRGELTIEGPAGSTAFIDGRDLGMVPVNEENLAAGMHYVRVEGTKGEKFGQAVEVGAGVAKVTASFGGGERAPIAVTSEVRVSNSLDATTVQRVVTLAKAVNAEYALVGFVSRSSETQLQAKTVLVSTKKSTAVALKPATFDIDVLTANTEAFALCDELVKQVARFGPETPLPISLGPSTAPVLATADAPKRPDDVEVAGPSGRAVRLVPETPATEPTASEPVVLEEPVTPPPPVARKAVSPWIWVAAGVALAAGAGVGGYFIVSNAVRPVTGTVNATW